MSGWNRRTIDHWRELPYPGERPECSWRLVGDVVHRVIPDGDGWSDAVTGEGLDLTDRLFVLAYGSNANPGKLHEIDALVLQAQITDARAVWCDGRRRRDHSVVATLAEAPGHVEACPVLAVTPEDLGAVDGWELPAYRRVNFWGRCTLENGIVVAPEVYVGGSKRQPKVINGNHLGLHDVDHDYVDSLVDPRW